MEKEMPGTPDNQPLPTLRVAARNHGLRLRGSPEALRAADYLLAEVTGVVTAFEAIKRSDLPELDLRSVSDLSVEIENWGLSENALREIAQSAISRLYADGTLGMIFELVEVTMTPNGEGGLQA